MTHTLHTLAALAVFAMSSHACRRAAPAPAERARAEPAAVPAEANAGGRPGVVASDAGAHANAPSAVDAARAAAPDAGHAAAGPVRVVFDGETVGGPARDFEGVVGDWYVAEADGQRGYRVDGSRWSRGTPSVSLADQARRLYGERYAEFLDGVRAFAFFPLAVYRGRAYAGDYRVSVRFYPQAGRVDQAAGIAFAIAPDGSYLCVRANALEDNVLYARVVRGRRTIVDTIRNTPTPSRTWHTLVLTVRGREIVTELDGVERHRRTLDAPPAGRVGLWSKADSQVLFDDFEVRPLP